MFRLVVGDGTVLDAETQGIRGGRGGRYERGDLSQPPRTNMGKYTLSRA